MYTLPCTRICTLGTFSLCVTLCNFYVDKKNYCINVTLTYKDT